MIKTANKIIATFFYSGFFPIAPGTFGSIIAALIWLLLPHNIILKAGLLIVTIGWGLIAANQFSQILNISDPAVIVIDEVAGLWLTLLFSEILLGYKIIWIVMGFLLFRLFDIIKPYPISMVEKLKGGWGIMADDIVAGIFSVIILILIKFV
ncbi:MAG: phosphatidylglycerophosphatase A [Candidatus Marinimicrobia bacterium]|nr:phosphatidylglycerophosphatase A [Candidatus Neomarinimicrobiota bacterium]